MNSVPVVLNGHNLTTEQVMSIAQGAQVSLCPVALDTMAAARKVIDNAVEQRLPVYGVTTGLGPRVTQSMPAESLDTFSLNTIRGRAHAVGTPLDRRWVRAGLAVRLNTLLIGAAGVRPAMAHHLMACLNSELTPVIPETGTIGVADLAWGGALGRSLIGEGEMMLSDNSVLPARQAMASAGIDPYKPQPREGLALVSHSALTAGLAALGWKQLEQCYEAAQTAAALSMEAFRSNLSPLDPRVLKLRPQPGQAEAASGLRSRLAGSLLFEPGEPRRLQDPLSLRNVAQVHGTVRATLDFAQTALRSELNGASDNPAVLLDDGVILSNGGYLPPHLCVSLTAASQSVIHLAALQVSRTGKLLFRRFSGLSNGLSFAGAEGAGMGPLMKTAEALYAEVAHNAMPPPIYPGVSADGLEDVQTHTAIPAKALFAIATRLRQLSAVEAIVAAQAIELREPAIDLPPALQQVLNTVRSVSGPLQQDRSLGAEIDLLAEKIEAGAFDHTVAEPSA